MINEEEISSIVTRLDEIVAKDAARVRFDMYGGGHDESMIVANAQGYLRLGIEFLKAGVMKGAHEGVVELDLDLDYMVTKDSKILFDMFQRDENLQEISRAEHKQAWWILALFIGVLLLIGLSMIVGFVTMVRWLI